MLCCVLCSVWFLLVPPAALGSLLALQAVELVSILPRLFDLRANGVRHLHPILAASRLVLVEELVALSDLLSNVAHGERDLPLDPARAGARYSLRRRGPLKMLRESRFMPLRQLHRMAVRRHKEQTSPLQRVQRRTHRLNWSLPE